MRHATATPAHWWALLAGNFVIGCGIMVVPGSLNDLSRSLQVPVPLAGQLVAISAALICLGAPLVALAVSRFDRRRFLTLTLLWYALGHAAAALAPDFGWLMPLRAVGVLAAAAFTPQAAAALAAITPPEQRGRGIAFIFLGWSLASVLGMPLAALVAETVGWRAAFALVAALGLPAAAWVWASMPTGVRPPALAAAQWRRALTHPVLLAVVLVTVLSASGQFSVFAYLAPTVTADLGGQATELSFVYLWFGLFGLAGNLALARWIDRLGPDRCVALGLGGIAVSMLLWPLGSTPALLALVMTPWALGCFSSNSAQQARLGAAAPSLAPALMALNTSAMYLGQAIGAAGGGVLVALGGSSWLPRGGLLWLLAALALSAWAMGRLRRDGAVDD